LRVVGDKALFDSGSWGSVRSRATISNLGSRAYRLPAAGLLAEDRRLREFFKQNRLLVLPLEEEVVFLRQCSERFPLYASLLKRIHDRPSHEPEQAADDPATRVRLMAAAAEALSGTTDELTWSSPPAVSADPYAEAARASSEARPAQSRDEMISAYERLVLFSSVDVDRLRAALRSVVVDQDLAVEELCDELSLFAAGTRDPRKPPAYFLVGPTGVGKNHLVESLCRLLEGIWKIEIPVLMIEGPNYTYPSDINELRGATRGFIRSDEEGLLSAFYERSSKAPFSVIVVDEVEKAHAHLRTFFLSILDRGTTTDNRGRILNFSNTMIFFTSNLGYSDAQQRSAAIGYLDEDARTDSSDRDVRAGLRRALTPEFMNRVRMIHFRGGSADGARSAFSTSSWARSRGATPRSTRSVSWSSRRPARRSSVADSRRAMERVIWQQCWSPRAMSRSRSGSVGMPAGRRSGRTPWPGHGSSARGARSSLRRWRGGRPSSLVPGSTTTP
jgi:hypothetical protein